MKRLRYLVTLSRPRFWLYLAGPVVLGLVYGADSVTQLRSPPSLVLVAYFLLPANVFLYGVNDVFDVDVDEANPKKEGDREEAWQGDPLVSVAVLASGVAISAPAALSSTLAWPWLAGFFLLAVEYSAPPLRFKTTPLLDSLSNALYILPGVAAYAAVAGSLPPTLLLVGGALWTMAMHTFSAVPDIEPDRDSGIETTATLLGETGAYAYCGVCWLLAAASFGLVDRRFGALALVYPALTASVALTDVDVDRAYWWFPWLNAAVGTVLTMNGLIQLVPPERVLPL
ncbi:MAG: prenyltransferase [Halolamina sp.]